MLSTFFKSFPKYGALVAVLIEWLSLLGFYTLNPSNFSSQQPLSYFATLPQTRLVFSVCYALAAISFWVFVQYHLSARYRTPTKMFTVSMLGFAAMAIFPFSYDNPVSSTIHNLLALFFSSTFIIGIYLMARRNSDQQLRIVSLVSAALSGITLTGFLLMPKDSPYIFIFEASSGFICELWMIWMSFHAFKRRGNILTD